MRTPVLHTMEVKRKWQNASNSWCFLCWKVLNYKLNEGFLLLIDFQKKLDYVESMLLFHDILQPRHKREH